MSRPRKVRQGAVRFTPSITLALAAAMLRRALTGQIVCHDGAKCSVRAFVAVNVEHDLCDLGVQGINDIADHRLVMNLHKSFVLASHASRTPACQDDARNPVLAHSDLSFTSKNPMKPSAKYKYNSKGHREPDLLLSQVSTDIGIALNFSEDRARVSIP